MNELTDWSDTIAQLQVAITDIASMKVDIAKNSSDIGTLGNNLTSLESYVQAVNDYAHSLESRISGNEQAIADLTRMIANFNANVDDKLQALETKLTNMINNVNSDFTEELEWLKNKVNHVTVELEEQIAELNSRFDGLDTSVINPWHSELGRITPQQNANLSYGDLADEVPTATEYCRLGLTAQDYTNFGLTAMEYARRGKEMLHYYWEYSPTYGFKQEISNVLTSIVTFIQNTLFADEYTALELTADDYSALDMTAQEYYSYRGI